MENKNIEIKLENPVIGRTWIGGSNRVEIVTVRRPVVRDILHMKNPPDQSDMVKLASNCTGLPEAAIHAMDLHDYQKILAVLTDLMAVVG